MHHPRRFHPLLVTILVLGLALVAGIGCHHGRNVPPGLPPSPPPAASNATASSSLNEDLRAELRAMARADLESSLDDKPVAPAESVRGRNEARLRAIIQEYGWPGNALVGREGARSAWLIAQHADLDLPFQRQCLALIQNAYMNGDVDGHDLAYLTDRVAAAEGKPQVYGTQGAHSYTAEQEAAIDERRRAVGLPSLSEFRAMVARGEYNRIHDPGF